MASTNPQCWPRVPPEKVWKRPGLPTEWIRVLERHPYPDCLSNDGRALPGYVWLDAPCKVRHVPVGILEFREVATSISSRLFPIPSQSERPTCQVGREC
jgi:hypothetical protein